jgi:hypothetical protein
LIREVKEKERRNGWLNFPEKPKIMAVDKWMATKNGYIKVSH